MHEIKFKQHLIKLTLIKSSFKKRKFSHFDIILPIFFYLVYFLYICTVIINNKNGTIFPSYSSLFSTIIIGEFLECPFLSLPNW